MVARRVEWIVVGAPGLPPLRMLAEGTPFGSVAVPPFVLIPAWALAGLIEPPGLRRVVRTSLVAVGVPLVILSGSRSAWLAIAAGVAIGILPWAWRQRRRLGRPRGLSARGLLIGAGVLVVGGVGLAVVLPRLTAVSSLLYRGALWRDTLVAWSSDPLLGIGPGFMPYARQAAAADFTFPVRQPHSHNLPLGLLGDAGIVGLAAGLLVVVTLAIHAGPWRSRTPVGRTAAVVLVGLGIGGLFEDLTFLPGFNLLAIALAAVALLDAGAVTWAPIRLAPPYRRLALLAGTGAIAVVLIAAMVTADAGAIAYRNGIKAAEAANWARLDLVAAARRRDRPVASSRTASPCRCGRRRRPIRAGPGRRSAGDRSSTPETRPPGRTSRSCARRMATCPARAKRRNARSPRRSTWLRSCSMPPRYWTASARPMPQTRPIGCRC